MKVFDVPGEPLLAGEEYATSTQDFMFNNAPMVELTDVKTTLEIQQIRERNFDSGLGLTADLMKRSDRSKQFAPGMLPNEYVIGTAMFSQGQCTVAVPSLCSAERSSRFCVWSIRGQVLPRTESAGTNGPSRQDDTVRRFGHLPPG